MAIPTDQEILDALKTAYKDAVTGKTVKIFGREYTTHDLDTLRKEIDIFQSRVDGASETDGGLVGVKFREPN